MAGPYDATLQEAADRMDQLFTEFRMQRIQRPDLKTNAYLDTITDLEAVKTEIDAIITLLGTIGS